MALDDIGEGLHLASSVVDLAKDILNRIDRDGPIKELNEDQVKIQNSFADNNLDEQWTLAVRLLNAIGHSFAPGGSVGDTDRQYRYHTLMALAELKFAKEIILRDLANSTKSK